MVLECRVKKFIRDNRDIIKKYRKYGCKKSPYFVKLPLKESKALLRMLGIIHGDGNMYGNRILITEKNKKFGIEISKLFNKLFGVKLNIFYDKNRNSYYFHIKNSVLNRYFISVLEIAKNSLRRKLKIPGYIKKLKFEFKKEYIGGLFDAEGWITKRQAHIGFSITNKKIRDFVSSILNKCKIKHTKNFRNRRKNIEYEIHIYGIKNIKKFQEKIIFTHQEKINQIKNHI